MDIYLSFKKWIEAGGPRRKWFTGLFAVSFVITGILFIVGGSSDTSSIVEPDPLYFAGVIIKMISVLLLIIGGAVLLRRWQIKGGFQRKDARLGILETIRLSPRQAIHLVRVGDRHLLIGATDQNINILTQVEIAEGAGQPTAASLPVQIKDPAMSFNQVLESFTSATPAGSDDGSNGAHLPNTASE